ncbi:MAG: bifunctional riboflavin kinase/FAD synthetase [Myxococcota bacterium]
MHYARGSDQLKSPPFRSAVTIGNFDGLHVGHRAIIDTVVRRASQLGGQSVVVTFEPHPRKVLHPDRAPKLLTTIDQRVELIAQAGIDIIVVEPFTEEFSRTSAETFIREILYERIRPIEVYVGYDFHFGRDREGSMRLLTEMGPMLGFSVTIIPEVTVDAGDVNSTRLRKMLMEGRVEESFAMLGRSYTIRATIVAGDGRGREVGYRTANLAQENEILPAPGVYAGRLRFLDDGEPAKGREFLAVTNVGIRPTFGDENRLIAEAHLLDFDADVYGRRIELSFAHRLRPERRFADVDALREQIAKDVEEGRRRLGAL